MVGLDVAGYVHVCVCAGGERRKQWGVVDVPGKLQKR